jgi:hypothetical protein
LEAGHVVVAAAACGERAAVHRVVEGLGAHLSFDSDGRQGVVAEFNGIVRIGEFDGDMEAIERLPEDFKRHG